MEPVSITCFHHEGSPGTGFRNSGAGGRHTSELCGRTVLQAFRERSKSSLASSRVSNTSRGEEFVPQLPVESLHRTGLPRAIPGSIATVFTPARRFASSVRRPLYSHYQK
jgi:hypothetical protein